MDRNHLARIHGPIDRALNASARARFDGVDLSDCRFWSHDFFTGLQSFNPQLQIVDYGAWIAGEDLPGEKINDLLLLLRVNFDKIRQIELSMVERAGKSAEIVHATLVLAGPTPQPFR